MSENKSETPNNISVNKVIIYVVAILAVGVIAFMIVKSGNSSDKTINGNSEVTLPELSTTTTTALPLNSTPKNDIDKFQDAIKSTYSGITPEILYDSNLGQYTVTWLIQREDGDLPNQSDDEIAAGVQARFDAVEILSALLKSKINYSSVVLVISGVRLNDLGNDENVEIVKAVYTKELVDKINFANFDNKKIFTITNDVKSNPEYSWLFY